MKKRGGFKFYWERFFQILPVILGIVLVFTFFDFFFHHLSKEYFVPGGYYRNKIIFGTLIGFASYYFIKKLKPFNRALAFSAIISVLLQAKYYLEGYPKDFVFIFLGIHFAILVPVSWIAFKSILK